MLKTLRILAASAFMAASSGVAPVVHAQPATPDFGDDASDFANDGECDDPRFKGPGMATKLLSSDILHDARDCETAWDNGDIELR